MLIRRGSAAAMVAIFVAQAPAATDLAIGPNAVVPAGAPLPAAYRPRATAACDHLGVCGTICPSGGSFFIADFAYDKANDRFAVIDVTSPDGIFWLDAASCQVGQYGSFAGVSQRGCAIDNLSGIVYTAGWTDHEVWRVDEGFNVLGSQSFEEDFGGLAVDEDGSRLYAATTADPDELIEYEIGLDGEITPSGRRWPIPWGAFSDGFSAASLEYDDCSGTFMAINQDANEMEYFKLQGSSLISTGHCPLPGGIGWGFGLDFARVTLSVADIASYSCDFPIVSLAPDGAVCGGGIDDLALRYEPLLSTAVQSYAIPYGARINNRTNAALTRTLWIELDAPPIQVNLGPLVLPPGSSRLFGFAGPLPMPVGTYSGSAHLGTSFMGEPEASTDFEFELARPGLQQ
ncbi:MAG: hypothetical protein CME06_15815 [Gemmatimonadetes bacterium]|nr:hypothetical protein [Gemmatimonadota bacterium]